MPTLESVRFSKSILGGKEWLSCQTITFSRLFEEKPRSWLRRRLDRNVYVKQHGVSSYVMVFPPKKFRRQQWDERHDTSNLYFEREIKEGSPCMLVLEKRRVDIW